MAFHPLRSLAEFLPERVLQKELESYFKDLPWTSGVWKFSQDSVVPWEWFEKHIEDIDLLANHLIRSYKFLAPKFEEQNPPFPQRTKISFAGILGGQNFSLNNSGALVCPP